MNAKVYVDGCLFLFRVKTTEQIQTNRNILIIKLKLQNNV